jgi:hypothetical protein
MRLLWPVSSVLLEVAERRGEAEIVRVEERLGQLEMGRRRAGIEAEGAQEGGHGQPERAVPRSGIAQGLGPAAEIGPAELEGDLGVPGERGSGPAEEADLGLGVGLDRPGPPAETGVPGHHGLGQDEDGQPGDRQDLFLQGDLSSSCNRP